MTEGQTDAGGINRAGSPVDARDAQAWRCSSSPPREKTNAPAMPHSPTGMFAVLPDIAMLRVTTWLRSVTPKSLTLVLVVLAGMLMGSSTASATPRSPIHRARLQHQLDRLVAAGAPGAVALVHEGKRTVILASGYANVRTRRRMRANDRFRIGSVTKSFVSTVVLQLVGEGRLSLHDSVERWLPGLVPNGDHITIRMLLNHTSGLFDYPQDQDYLQQVLQDPTRAWTPQQLIAVATAHQPNFSPGASWSYSNTGYIVLGLVVEKVTDHSLGDELERRILAPLHLRHTTFDTQPRMAAPYAHGYAVFDKPPAGDVSVWSPSFAGAAGAMVSDAGGIARFYRALFGGRLLRPELLRNMQTTVHAEPGLRYGLGLMKKLSARNAPCGVRWGHDGDFPGYRSEAYSSLDGKHQVVVFVNEIIDMLPPPAQRALRHVISTAYCG